MSTVVLTILVIVLLALVIFGVIKSIRSVPQEEAGIVERWFGRRRRKLDPGPHFVLPYIDRWRVIDMRVQIAKLRAQELTHDQMKVIIEIAVHFQVEDALKAVYQIRDYDSALQEQTASTVCSVAAGMDMDALLNSRDQFKTELKNELVQATAQWGLQIRRVELSVLEPSPANQRSIENAKIAERDREATERVLMSQANMVLLSAASEAASQGMRAQGQADAISRLFSAVSEGNPEPQEERMRILQYLLAPQYLPSLGQGRLDGYEMSPPPPESSPEHDGTD
jgi:regulator of protease activity HflC (stomatin/prohibitin superfamily)